jgi:protein TonB
MMQIFRMLGLVLAVAACGGDEPLVQAEPIDAPTSPFKYPVALWDKGIEGEVLLLVRVTETGQVDSVKVERSSGRAAFDSAATRGATQLRFLPAHRGGRTLATWLHIPVRFTRDSTAADTASQ